MTYRQAILKLSVEKVLIFPFIALGRLAGKLFPLKTTHTIFLFFPNADIGGSPQVNIDITDCVKDRHPLIIFSKKPRNNKFEAQFRIPGVRIIDLQKYIDKKLFHFINIFFRGVIASWINSAENAVVLGGECIYFYKIIPHIRKNIPVIELCHLGVWMPYTIGFIDRIDTRVFSTEKLKEAVIQQYEDNKIQRPLYDRLLFIDNTIDIPPYHENRNEVMQVVFIGRGSPQKRVHLVAAIAQKMHEEGDKVHFSFVGDVENSIDIKQYPYCSFYGNVGEVDKMESLYAASDVLILTSAFEGLPVVVMKMMAYGKTVISTAVNGIPDYIRHMENGLLITETVEPAIVEQGVSFLRILVRNPGLRIQLGLRSREIAMEKFSRKVFCEHYRHLLRAE